MKQNFISRKADNLHAVKQQMLNWVKQFSIFCFLDNQEYSDSDPAFECLLGAGCRRSVSFNSGFTELRSFINDQEWLFGHLGYDLKNKVEDLSSENFDGVGFDDGFFFIPKVVIILKNDEVIIYADDPEKIYEQMMNTPIMVIEPYFDGIPLQPKFSRDEYISTVETLRQHILRGDCYEINFCQEFYAEGKVIDPLTTFSLLTSKSPNPFSAFYRVHNKYLMCASPERYLKKTGSHIISQPIKGTSKREVLDIQKDTINKDALLNSVKERSENVMIVDLVRNDLSRVCKEGTVKVEKLFEIQSFPQVHQMISTVGGEVADDIAFTDIIKATFPMGSMTGAPKKRVMELIEKYERTKRGLFSGSVGYIKPGGDFDFNVVIRSILYNSSSKYLSVQVGSAITFASIPHREYEECLMKVEGVLSVTGY